MRKNCVKLLVLSIVATFSLCGSGMGEDEDVITFRGFPTVSFLEANITTLPPGDISGQVVMPTGKMPDVFIRIILIDPDNREVIRSALSDSEGAFTLRDVPEGRYLIRVGLPGKISVLDVKQGAGAGFSPTTRITVPAGVIRGGIAMPGGEIPFDEKVHLIDPETDDILMTTDVDEYGAFVLEDVSEGLYIVKVETPGLLLNLNVAGNDPAFMNIIVPRIAMVPVRDKYSPPVYLRTPGGAVLAGAAYYWYRADRRDRRRPMTPIMP